jgi:hypothetical protein
LNDVNDVACRSTPSIPAIGYQKSVRLERRDDDSGKQRSQQRWPSDMIHGDVLEQVEVYKNLGRMMAQDDNNAQAIRAQLRKARATWA